MLIFHTAKAMTQDRIQARGRARLAGQLKATINTMVTMIGIKAISAYIVHPPIFLAGLRGIMPAVARAMWGKCRGTGSSGVALYRVACKLWGKVEREAGIIPGYAWTREPADTGPVPAEKTAGTLLRELALPILALPITINKYKTESSECLCFLGSKMEILRIKQKNGPNL